MRINEIIEITNGELKSSPSISYFKNITSNIDDVKSGTLFILTNQELLDKAISSGAYGIIYQDEQEIKDTEIAWIKVDSLQESISRLVRYKLITKKSSIIYLPKIEFELAKQIYSDENTSFVDGELLELLEGIEDQKDKIIINNKKLLCISLEYTESIIPDTPPFTLISNNLFDSKIFFEGNTYNIALPKIFLKNLSAVIDIFKSENIKFNLEQYQPIKYLKPNFISTQGKLTKYGQSTKVAIAEDDLEEFKKYMTYIATNAKWGKILFLLPSEYIDIFSHISDAKAYSDKSDLIEHLKNENYNFALIFGINDEFLLNSLQNQETKNQTLLFQDL